MIDERKEKMFKQLICQMLEAKYVRAMGRKVEWKENINDDLYPEEWFIKKDYVRKANILGEAIKNKCLIVNTTRYLEWKEEIKKKKIKI